MSRIFIFILCFVAPASAFGFCGFYVGGGGESLYNDATNVVLMREGTRTVLSMQNDYSGPPEDFALVIPVPQVLKKENVKTLERSLLKKVDDLAAPRLVEYWEQDPCREEEDFEDEEIDGDLDSPDSVAIRVRKESRRKPVVKIEAKFSVAEYEILVLSADDSTGLNDWLVSRKYNIPKEAPKYFQPYVEAGMYFFVAKVNAKKVAVDPGGRTQLSPLRFHYDTGDFTLPIRLGLINSRGTQDLIVHILARDQRYEVGNYPGITIPTNFELTEASRDVFGDFYASLFDAVMKYNPGSVVTEYAWQATKCDPCPPGSAGLSNADIMSLGADVISFEPKKEAPTGLRTDKDRQSSGKFIPFDMVLTRLHARYGQNEIGRDLVFKRANGIVGGRPNDTEYFAATSNYNQFQGRYIIRHPWDGPISCENPERGVWGRPNRQQMKLATQTAYSKNRDLKLSTLTTKDVNLKKR